MFTFPVQLIVEIIIMSLSPHHQRRRRSLGTSQHLSNSTWCLLLHSRCGRREDQMTHVEAVAGVWRRPWRKTCWRENKVWRSHATGRAMKFWSIVRYLGKWNYSTYTYDLHGHVCGTTAVSALGNRCLELPSTLPHSRGKVTATVSRQ